MKKFEIHITGDSRIIGEFNNLGIKSISVDLLYKNGLSHRTEYMSSFVSEFESIELCKIFINNLVNKLKSKVIRVKIETPYYEEYVDKSVYIETHFIPKDDKYPLSKNLESGKWMATDRCYDKSRYVDFIDKWYGEEIELCVFDSYVNEDLDWFKIYESSQLS